MDRLVIDNPFTGDVAAERPLADDTMKDTVLDAATTASRHLRDMTVEQRQQLCRTALDAMLAQREAMAADITRMMGKPLGQSNNEINAMEGRARHMTDIASEALADHVVDSPAGHERRIERVPLGVVLNMPAWNYPLLTCVNVVFPAVVAGNAVVLKHSSRSALCGEHFARAFEAAGAPEGSVSALHCDHDMAAKLAADRRVGYVAFTGSVAGGHAVYRAVASGHFADAGLELGGKDGAYVAEDADIASAIEGLVDGATYNAGQSCCAVERVYVHAKHYDDFVAGARDAIDKLRLGDPMTEVDMGPMAQPKSGAFIESQVSAAQAAGAEVLVGGSQTQVDGRGRFFEPTLVTGVHHEMDIMRSETFGPVLPVMKVSGDAEAIALMNDSDLGLTGSVWTKDRDHAARLARQLEVGTVYMNRCDVLDPALPWTGVKDTGKGSTLSHLGLLHLTRPRAWLFKL